MPGVPVARQLQLNLRLLNLAVAVILLDLDVLLGGFNFPLRLFHFDLLLRDVLVNLRRVKPAHDRALFHQRAFRK